MNYQFQWSHVTGGPLRVNEKTEGRRTEKLDGIAEGSERRVALGFAPKIPLKAGCKPALQLFCPAHKTESKKLPLCHFDPLVSLRLVFCAIMSL